VKTILNKTMRPIKVPLSGGKVLYLGPARTGQVADRATEAAAFLRLLEAGAIEILGEGSPRAAGTPAAAGGAETTQGHPPDTLSHRRGNR